MCYNVNAKARIEALQKRFSAFYENERILKEYEIISGFAHPELPVIASEAKDKIQLMKWGLVPKWVKDETTAKEFENRTLNARAETIFQKPTFKSIFNKRCLILVNGFYEWQHDGKKKIKYFIHLKEPEIFALGGLYDEWTNPETGEITKGFSIITVPANPLMEKIHNTKKRMPLILERATEKEWINDKLNKEQILDLIRQYPEQNMIVQAI